MADPFVTHGSRVDSELPEGRFVSIGDGPKQVLAVEGLLLGREESSKYPGNLVYTFGTADEILKVGGNTFLQDKIVEIGALYRITFTGRSRSKTGKQYKTFEVFTVNAEQVKANGYDKGYKSTASAETGGDEKDLPF